MRNESWSVISIVTIDRKKLAEKISNQRFDTPQEILRIGEVLLAMTMWLVRISSS